MTTIKITELTNIGANLNGNTLVPVVNMNGTPVTQRSNVENLANYVLNTGTGANLGAVGNITITGGTDGYVLQTDGAGNLSWVAQTGGGNGTPGGANTQIQFNDAGSFGGDSGLTFNKTTNDLTVAGNIVSTDGNVTANWVIGDYVSGNATPLHHIPGANVTGAVSFATTANAVAAANVSGLGNVALVNFDGNSSNVLYGNGVFDSIPNPFNQDLNTTDNVTFANITTTDAIRFTNSSNIVGAMGYAPNYVSIEGYGSNSVQITTNDLLTWSFNSEGILTFPEGTTTTGSSIETPAGDDFSITTSSITSVSAPCAIAVGDEFVADTEFNDDITVVQVGWTVSINGTDYTVTYIDPSPPAHQYRITAAGATFVQNTTYTFSDPVPATHNWTISETGVLSTPGGGTISQQSDFIISVSGTDRIDLRTENGDAILDAEGNLNLTGNLVFSGGAIIDPTDNNFEVRGVQNVNFEANAVVNIYTDGSNNAYQWQFGDDGNLTLPGNTFAVNYANGTPVSIGGGGGNTGNVTFDNVTVQGVNGLNLSAGSDFTANLAYLQVRAGDVASHIHLDTGNNQAYDLIVGDDQKHVQVSSTGNIIMSSYDVGNGLGYTWTLDNTGNMSMPLNINFNGGGIQQIANEDLYIRASDAENDGWSLYTIVDDGAGNTLARTQLQSDRFRITTNMTGASYDWSFQNGQLNLPGNIQGIYGGNTSFYAYDNGGGGSVELKTISYIGDTLLSNVSVGNTNVTISTQTAAHTWTFDGDGNLQVPGNIISTVSTGLTLGSNYDVFIVADRTDNNRTWKFDGAAGELILPNNGVIDPSDNNFEVRGIQNVNFEANATVNIYTDTSNNGWQWQFGDDGNLTIPGNIVSSLSASPAPILSGFGFNGSEVIAQGNVKVNTATGNLVLGRATATGSPGLSSTSSITLTSNREGTTKELVFTTSGDLSLPGNISTSAISATGKIGYASGSTVTQTTNRGQGVTINALAGTIVTTSDTIASNDVDVFYVNNNLVDPTTDIVIAQITSYNPGTYVVIAQPSATPVNGFMLSISNFTAFASPTEVITIRFMVLKSPNA